MDYAFLPPEINSARMYSGPGPNSMLVAAASWDALAAELASAAENYGSVIARLTGMHWWGPASTSMLAMSAPYVEWLERTAAQTKQTATQARAAAAAFEQAHAMTVPPALVTANRAELKRTDRVEPPGPEHRSDRSHRGTVRRDVGTRRGRDVRLRHHLSGGETVDAVLLATTDHQPGRASRPERRGHPGRHQLRREHADRIVATVLFPVAGSRGADGMAFNCHERPYDLDYNSFDSAAG